MGILSTGVRAMQANQMALQTTGNNISNVNTIGYSRQQTVMQAIPGHFSGAGYIGNGVSVQTVTRAYSDFLTRQSTTATSIQSADSKRSEMLKQLENIFRTGPGGLGASIGDMLNAFSDVVSTPSDLTARTNVLTRIDETAARIRATATQLDELTQGINQDLSQRVTAINDLATRIAQVNDQIIRANASGQQPHDLLDRRDQLVTELNKYIQTTSVAADDGSVGLFIGGSQSLVLGTTTTPVRLVSDDFADAQNKKLAISRNGLTINLDENTLGGGDVAGLLRFQSTDLAAARNMLGRLTLAITTSMNEQHRLGIDLDGNPGGNLFSPITFSSQNVLEPRAPATLNTGTMTGAQAPTLAINDLTQLMPSDYEMVFLTPTSGTITRRYDGLVTTFPQVPAPTGGSPTLIARVDGLDFDNPNGGSPAAGDRFVFKPYVISTSNINSLFSAPRSLAMASPVAAAMSATNMGTLQQGSLIARSNPVSATPVVLTFTGSNTYTRSDEIPPDTTVFTYTPGETIEGTTPTTDPLSEWSLVLQGSPVAGDTVTIGPNSYPRLNAGNASAMLALRDVAMFDGGAMTDGYAGLIAELGTRSQSAMYAAEVSNSIATDLERDRSAVSGVNLDEEAARLLQYQQAYQASAKMVQIAQTIFDTLLERL